MTARRSRRRSAAYAALALGLAGSLALTGCNSHSSKKSKKSSSSSSKSKKRKIIGGGAAAAGAGAGAGAASRSTTYCTTGTQGDYKFITRTDPSHVILKYHNSKSRSCYLYNSPMLYFGTAKQPLGYYEGAPSFGKTQRIEVPARGDAYASIPTTTAADKGTKQSVVKIGFMNASEPTQHGLSANIHLSQYASLPSVGKTAKVSDWYLSDKLAEIKTNTGK
ncbi:hypothetical protein ACH4SK_19360 [Streptomyces inhibens]|uniref:hypothetical protein n=1 Tax=Streptomyces inhibens TaxID=2293571 RepID=UPI0037AAFACA